MSGRIASARQGRKAKRVDVALGALRSALVEADDPGDEYLMRAATELHRWRSAVLPSPDTPTGAREAPRGSSGSESVSRAGGDSGAHTGSFAWT